MNSDCYIHIMHILYVHISIYNKISRYEQHAYNVNCFYNLAGCWFHESNWHFDVTE